MKSSLQERLLDRKRKTCATTTNRRASKFFGGFSEQVSLDVNESNDTSQTFNQSPENEEE